MRLTHAVRAGAWLLVGLNLLLSFGAIGLLTRMTPAIAQIMERNGQSIKACEDLLTLFALAGDHPLNQSDQEKALALRTGLLLRDSLVSKGYDVTMTRDSDWYPALTDRSAQANMMDADAFISIHYNSAGATSASGIETFAYATEDNKRLASSIQAQLIANTGAANRGVKNGNKLIVLNTTKVPAVLLELGFLSNPTEAKRMLENDYQNTLAESIAKGVDIYFGR